jgi:hypothetical protein
MLVAIAAVLLVLWLLGFFVLHLGALVHALIVIAIIVAIVHLVWGRGARGGRGAWSELSSQRSSDTSG